MLWLPLSLLLSFGFGQLFKWAQRRGCYAPVVVSANYLTIASLLLVYFGLSGGLDLAPGVFKVGAFTGCTFIVAMLLMTYGLQIADVAAVLTSFRLAILVPIWIGVWAWGETLTATQALGIALTLAALVLMTHNTHRAHHHAGWLAFALLPLIFLVQGLAHCGARWVHYAGLDAHYLQVLLVITLVAGISGSLFIAVRAQRPVRQDLVMGIGIGLYNLVALVATLKALSYVSGTLFFPLQGCVVVVLDNLFAQFLWKEPLTWPTMAGAGLGVVAMVLVL